MHIRRLHCVYFLTIILTIQLWLYFALCISYTWDSWKNLKTKLRFISKQLLNPRFLVVETFKDSVLNIYLKIKTAVDVDFWKMLQFSKSHEELGFVTSLINLSCCCWDPRSLFQIKLMTGESSIFWEKKFHSSFFLSLLLIITHFSRHLAWLEITLLPKINTNIYLEAQHFPSLKTTYLCHVSSGKEARLDIPTSLCPQTFISVQEFIAFSIALLQQLLRINCKPVN